MPQSTRGQSARESTDMQQRMTRWTMWVGIFTGLLVITSVIGNLFIYLQYYAATTAQFDNREQLRAVVSFSNATIILPEDTGKDGVIAIVPTFHNYGATRTSKFSAVISLKFFEGGIPSSLDVSKPYLAVEPGESVIGPNSPYQALGVSISVDDVKKAKDDKGQILFWGHAQYADVFEPKTLRNIYFCNLMKPQNTPDGKLSLVPITYKASCNYNS